MTDILQQIEDFRNTAIKKAVYDRVVEKRGDADLGDVMIVCKSFGTTVDIPIKYLNELMDEGRIREIPRGIHCVYEAV